MTAAKLTEAEWAILMPHIHWREWDDARTLIEGIITARLARVTALLNTPDGEREWHNQGRSGFTPVVDVRRLRAAVANAGDRGQGEVGG